MGFNSGFKGLNASLLEDGSRTGVQNVALFLILEDGRSPKKGRLRQ